MICKNCGKNLPDNTRFCDACGASLTINEPTKTTDNKGLVSLILGVCSLFFGVLLPIPIVGLILGIACKEKGPKKTIGIILNALMLVLYVLILTIVAFSIFKTVKDVSRTKRIGSPVYGYVQVPTNWNEFVDADESSSIQYYYDKYIVTLSVIDVDMAIEDVNAKIVSNIKDAGATANYNTVTIAGYAGYEVKAHYSDGIYLNTYLFKAEDNRIHYIAIEGPDKDSKHFQIPNSFTLE